MAMVTIVPTRPSTLLIYGVPGTIHTHWSGRASIAFALRFALEPAAVVMDSHSTKALSSCDELHSLFVSRLPSLALNRVNIFTARSFYPRTKKILKLWRGNKLHIHCVCVREHVCQLNSCKEVVYD